MMLGQIQTLKAEVQGAAYAGKTAKEIARMLVDYPMVANPDPAPQVPKPITANAVRTVLDGLGASEVVAGELIALARAQDREGIADWAEMRLSGAKLTAVQDYLAQTIADPDHPATVRGECRVQELGLEDVEDDDGRRYHLWGMRPYVQQILDGEL